MGKKVAVIGAGTAGLLFAHKLLQYNTYDVTLFSDRTAEQWLNECPPTGSAFAYGISTAIERAAGLNDYTQSARPGDGVLFNFTPSAGMEKITLAGKWPNLGAAVDVRRRIFDWLHQFEVRGGNLVIASMTLDRLVEISDEYDDIFIAAGKGEIGALFGRNDERPHYKTPQRNLIMMITDQIADWNAASHVNNPVVFNFYADAGEMFYVPYSHKSGTECYNLLFEAKEGSYMDAFDDANTPEELNEAAKQWLTKHAPWDASNVQAMTAIANDTFSTLKGKIPPHVRNDYGLLPNGKPVFPLGDTWCIFDPIGGQGINNGTRQVDFIGDRYIELGLDRASPEWALENYGFFYEHHTKWACLFNNLLLEPLSDIGKTTLLYGANNQRFCDEVIMGMFHAPKVVYKVFSDAEYAAQKYREYAPYLNEQLQLPDWVPAPVRDKLTALQAQGQAA
jgi:2-polyprenyl-6-methoxyphenol hydroxylase-like FAD-dependent oxidoreductase